MDSITIDQGCVTYQDTIVIIILLRILLQDCHNNLKGYIHKDC